MLVEHFLSFELEPELLALICLLQLGRGHLSPHRICSDFAGLEVADICKLYSLTNKEGCSEDCQRLFIFVLTAVCISVFCNCPSWTLHP